MNSGLGNKQLMCRSIMTNVQWLVSNVGSAGSDVINKIIYSFICHPDLFRPERSGTGLEFVIWHLSKCKRSLPYLSEGG